MKFLKIADPAFRAAAGFSTAFVDPYAALRSKQPLPTDPEGSE